jgi:folate-binding protein YgfZ
MHEQAEAAFLPYGPDIQIVESYGEVEAEYAAIRKAAALMDAPHRSVVILTGKDRLSFLHNKVTNDTNRLTAGTGCYAYLLNLKGRIVMDLNILHTEEATLVEIDRRLAPEFLQMMEKYIFTEDVRLLDGSEQLGRLTLLGPRANLLLQKVAAIANGAAGGAGLGESGVESLTEPFRHAKRLIGKSTVTVYRNDLAGEPQYELIVPRDQLVSLWQILHEAGGHDDGGHEEPIGSSSMASGAAGNGIHLRAIGWSAFNTARIEAGTPLYGIDITDHYLPMETAHWYPRAVSVTKGCYLGQEIVARMHAHNTVARMLVGLRVQGDKLPLAGTDIADPTLGGGGQQVGIITSSCMSPMLGNTPIALGYVKKAYAPSAGAAGGTRPVEVLAEGLHVPAEVVPLPVWKRQLPPEPVA